MYRQTSVNYVTEVRASVRRGALSNYSSRSRLKVRTAAADNVSPQTGTDELRWLPVAVTKVLIALGLL